MIHGEARIRDRDTRSWENFERFIKETLPDRPAAELLHHSKSSFWRQIAERRRREQGLSAYFRLPTRR